VSKKAFLFAIGLILGMSLWAEGSDSLSPRRFSVSWSVSMSGQPDVFSRVSVLGFGLALVATESLDLRNRLTFRNGTMNREDSGEKFYQQAITDKITLGRMTRNGLFRPYGFLEGSIGLSGEAKWEPFDNAKTLGFALGSGCDVFVSDRVSYFTEIGFYGLSRGGSFIPQQGFELGVEGHF